MSFIQLQGPIFGTSYDDIISSHNGKTFAELKNDGYRFQLHNKNGEVTAYSRSGLKVPFAIYPEVAAVKKLPDCVLDCELHGHGNHIAAFNAVHKRFRWNAMSNAQVANYLRSDTLKGNPLQLTVFDTLKWEGKDLRREPLEQRRVYTENIHEKNITPSNGQIVTSGQELESLFEKMDEHGQEGLVCKDLKSIYDSNPKSPAWVKVKRFETIDAVVVGVYEKNQRPSQVLCAVNGPEQLETVGIVSLERESVWEQFTHLKNQTATDMPYLRVNEQLFAQNMPSYFVEPKTVVELRALNIVLGKNVHSCGLQQDRAYTLRIGWLYRMRPDKNPTQLSTTKDVIAAYARCKHENE
jgi:bifunctional non-homologous end joining protein LigD